MKIQFLICFIALTQYSFAQGPNEYLTLQSLIKPKKVAIIKVFDHAALEYSDSLDEVHFFEDFEIVYHDTYDKGFEVKNDSVDLCSNKYDLNGFIFNSSDTTYVQSIMNVSFGGDGYGYYRKCHISDLNYITVNNKIRPYANAGIFFSLFTGLVISPLVSYDFKSKSMRKEKYNTWTATSLISSALFIGFRIPLKDKTYQLKDNNIIKAEWEIIRK